MAKPMKQIINKYTIIPLSIAFSAFLLSSCSKTAPQLKTAQASPKISTQKESKNTKTTKTYKPLDGETFYHLFMADIANDPSHFLFLIHLTQFSALYVELCMCSNFACRIKRLSRFFPCTPGRACAAISAVLFFGSLACTAIL